MLLTGSLLATTNSAQAYNPNPTVRWAQVDTDDCRRLGGNLTVSAQSDGCRVNDSWDGTFFRKDPNGIAIKVELYVGSTLVAKSEFHPYGEVLWVYDTRDDSDTIYTTLRVAEFGDSYGPYRGPVNGANTYNLSITDGRTVTMSVNDNNDPNNLDQLIALQGTA
ncbi:hypothetical protein [Saccharothrix coeruleofusca]|uniref:hypothetical protein n=1 Tax=Saccharothrix coeruleofusca TaxID=33919 RepID=UPI00167046E7|nr:hypothetical protein [Saccharothrix coeruleofusca]MBP2335665.1 hypothetical protein [Saccharothrix coeruleofusca]